MAFLRITDWSTTFVFVYIIIKMGEAFEICEEHSRSYKAPYYMYCEYSCCGYIYNRYCCENFSGLVAGAVVGSLVFLAIVMTVIVCVIKKKGQRGTVIAPLPGGHVTQHSVAFVTAPHIQPNYSQAPPAYGVAPGYQVNYSHQTLYRAPGHCHPPPAYSSIQDCAYPPAFRH